MHDLHSEHCSPLTSEKAAYFRWRENLSGYEDHDSHVDEDQQLRRHLRITAKDEAQWRALRDSQFQIEF
jgi:hypothetical protein